MISIREKRLGGSGKNLKLYNFYQRVNSSGIAWHDWCFAVILNQLILRMHTEFDLQRLHWYIRLNIWCWKSQILHYVCVCVCFCNEIPLIQKCHQIWLSNCLRIWPNNHDLSLVIYYSWSWKVLKNKNRHIYMSKAKMHGRPTV